LLQQNGPRLSGQVNSRTCAATDFQKGSMIQDAGLIV